MYFLSAVQVALRWLIQKDAVTSVIIGCKTLSQLEDNWAASSGWQLSDDEMESLNMASQKPLPYPYEIIQRMNAKQL